MTDGLLLGIDIGTSACKVIALDVNADVVATGQATYPLHTPQPGWAEQAPQDWWDAVVSATKQVLQRVPATAVIGIGICGQMHGLVALDKDRRVLRDAILWNDQRNERECEWLIEQADGLDGLLELTNNTMLPGYTAGKLVWLREHEPQVWARMRAFLNPKDYVRYRLTGDLITEVSDASGTGLLDVRRRTWSSELLALAGIPEDLMPALVESEAVTGSVSHDAVAEMGLPQGIPVVGGGGDSVLQTTSMGIVDAGVLGITLGTAGIVAGATDHCPDNPGGLLQVSCGNAPDRWHVMGVALNAGGAWEWWRRTLAPVSGGTVPPHEVLIELAEKSPPGARGAHFLPYLLGERCPQVDAAARASWTGLSMSHDVSDLTRAVLEGALYNLRQVRDLFVTAGLASDRVRVSGGASAHDIWGQSLADILGTEVRTVTGGEQGGAYGAALLAGVGVGVFANLADLALGIRETGGWKPDQDRMGVYDEAFARFKEIYPATSTFARRAKDGTT